MLDGRRNHERGEVGVLVQPHFACHSRACSSADSAPKSKRLIGLRLALNSRSAGADAPACWPRAPSIARTRGGSASAAAAKCRNSPGLRTSATKRSTVCCGLRSLGLGFSEREQELVWAGWQVVPGGGDQARCEAEVRSSLYRVHGRDQAGGGDTLWALPVEARAGGDLSWSGPGRRLPGDRRGDRSKSHDGRARGERQRWPGGLPCDMNVTPRNSVGDRPLLHRRPDGRKSILSRSPWNTVDLRDQIMDCGEFGVRCGCGGRDLSVLRLHLQPPRTRRLFGRGDPVPYLFTLGGGGFERYTGLGSMGASAHGASPCPCIEAAAS